MTAHLFTLGAIEGVQLTVFAVLFLAVSGLGFFASRWRRAKSLDHLDEWASADATSAPGSAGS